MVVAGDGGGGRWWWRAMALLLLLGAAAAADVASLSFGRMFFAVAGGAMPTARPGSEKIPHLSDLSRQDALSVCRISQRCLVISLISHLSDEREILSSLISLSARIGKDPSRLHALY